MWSMKSSLSDLFKRFLLGSFPDAYVRWIQVSFLLFISEFWCSFLDVVASGSRCSFSFCELVSKYQPIFYTIAPISSIALVIYTPSDRVKLRKHSLTFIRLVVETHLVAVKIYMYELPPDLHQTNNTDCWSRTAGAMEHISILKRGFQFAS